MQITKTAAGRLAIVTGAAGGQGRALAIALGRRGYALGLIDTRADAVAQLAAELAAEDILAQAIAVDVSDRDAVRAGLEQCAARFGAPFILASTAAILRGGLLMEMDDAAFAETLRVNIMGTLVVNTEVARLMIEAGRGGRIVNWSSVSSKHGSLGYGAYCASKSAVESLTKSVAVALAPHGISVNAILPGSIETEMLGYFDEAARSDVAAGIPLGRWGQPDDIVAAALFLLGDDAGWTTGTEVVVDGGLLSSYGAPDLTGTIARLERERAHLTQRKVS